MLPHPRVVNSAFFSPVTGRKLLTTCQDNRLRVWDNVVMGGEAREIVHSHDFNRVRAGSGGCWLRGADTTVPVNWRTGTLP